MQFGGVKIDVQGFELGLEQQTHLNSFIEQLNKFFPISQLRLKFIKNNRLIEGMVWCQAHDIPIGVYNRCTSFSQLTKSLMKKISRECRKIQKLGSIPVKRKVVKRPNVPQYDLVG